MSEAAAKYKTALDDFEAILSAVPAGAWENQSPCSEWKSVDVVGHVIGGQHMVATLAGGGELGGAHPTTRELAGSDPVVGFKTARATAEASLNAEAMAKVVNSPFGPMPLENFLKIFVLDVVTHTWDLARAAGLPVTLNADLVHEGFENIRPMDAGIRMPGVMGPKLEAPAGAAEQEQLMAFLGRQV